MDRNQDIEGNQENEVQVEGGTMPRAIMNGGEGKDAKGRKAKGYILWEGRPKGDREARK